MAQGRRGFTLIELAVVLALLGLAAVVALPRLDDVALRRANVASAANKLAACANHARSRAVATARPHVLALDLGAGDCWVAAAPADRDDVPQRSEAALRFRLPEGVAFARVLVLDARPVERGVAAVRFSPEGWADRAVIHLSGAGEREAAVVIRPLTGAAETYDGHVDLAREEFPNER